MLANEIPFEIHLTTENLTEARQIDFVSFCANNEAKPLLIELAQGEFVNQPMLSRIIYANSVADVLSFTSDLSAALSKQQFQVRRTKIEIPSMHYSLLQDYQVGSATYFEWHGKINYDHQEEILRLCEHHKVHLSRNSLKNEPDKRFITLREYGEKTIFDNRIAQLISDFERHGRQIFKQQAEYCIYDTNQMLDKGWLPQ